MEVMLAEAAAKSKIIKPTEEEQTSRTREWFSSKIKKTAAKIRNLKHSIAGDLYFLDIVELEKILPGDTRLEKLRNLEREMTVLRAELNLELNRVLSVEADKENEDLMITMRTGDSSKFHKTSRVTKVILNEDPQLIIHNGKTYSGEKVLDAFTSAAIEQSGEIVNVRAVQNNNGMSVEAFLLTS